VRDALLLGLLLVGCSPAPSVSKTPSAPAPLLPADAPSPPPPPPAVAPTPLGFDDFTLSPSRDVEWTERIVASASLMRGVAPGTDVSYRWFVDGAEVRAWRREFLRHREGKWERGELVEVYAVAEDGSGRQSRTETLGIWVGRAPVAAEPRPPIDWDARHAADDRIREERRRREEPVQREPEAPVAFPRSEVYVNPLFGEMTLDPDLFPRPRRGITTGPQQRVDGYTPGEQRVDGYTPGEQRVDGYTPGEPRVGRN